jgi:prepilin-type N-terminal cleavage/methylation domain-containing protein
MKLSRIRPGTGFTLVELLVVIAIIAVLVTVSITVTFRFRKAADRTSAMNAMRQIQMANISYATQNAGSFIPPEAKEVGADGVVTGETYKWFENPDFISQLKGEVATFSGNGVPDVSLPPSLMDLAVLRVKSAANTTLGNCFGYTAPSDGSAYRQSLLSSPGDSAAFITCDEPFVDHSSKAKIAYRHQDKALVVYYDGRVSVLTKADISRIDSEGGATGVFWKADGGPIAP